MLSLLFSKPNLCNVPASRLCRFSSKTVLSVENFSKVLAKKPSVDVLKVNGKAGTWLK